ncbi:MAG: argininosuccinate synthase [Actinomycetota bacterium]|nr:argininosuccinate synthase [Actinomycetota bacterium]
MNDKVVLAYSGGLDTSISVKWIKEKYNMDVVAALIDCGQPGDLKKAYQRALDIGACKSVIIDAKEEFIDKYIFPSIKANLKYEKKYPLATALARPLIVEKLVDIAKNQGAKAVAHGCTAKGNDQVRFDVGIRSLAPDLKIIAPLREWALSREEAIKYAADSNIKIPVTKKTPYSIDENLWGRSIECGVLEDPWREPPENIYQWTEVTSDKKGSEYMEIGFLKGIPISLNGKNIPAFDIINKVNRIAGSYGIGRVDMIENRLVGIKSREIYESPAAEVIIEAHRQLESMILDRELVHYKYLLEEKLAELVYYGYWHTPLRECVQSFMEESQKFITGTVKIKLGYKNFSVVGRKSKFSLYDINLATYDKADKFEQKHSESFIKLWGYPYEILSKKRGTNEE